jgi:hypothetical protein
LLAIKNYQIRRPPHLYSEIILKVETMQTEIGIRRHALLVASAMLWPVVALGAPPSPPPGPSVTVVNTPANPVPVTGSLGVSGSVTVNNSASSPVPVTIVLPSATPTVTCRLDLGSISEASPFVNPVGASSSGIGNLVCPPGVTAIDVQRVQYDPWGSTLPSKNVANFNLLLGLAPTFPGDFNDAVLFPALTNAAPQADLPAPIRLDKASGTAILNQVACSSGIAGFNATCGGRVYFMGN